MNLQNNNKQNSQPVNKVFPSNAFLTLRMIREDIDWMSSKNQEGKFTTGIEKEAEIYKEVMRRYVG